MAETPTDNSVLVTGGAGFIGSSLVDRMLAEGRRVVVIDNLSTGSLSHLDDARRDHAGSLEFHRLELVSDAVGEVVARARPDVVFHCATGGRDHDDPVRVARDVVDGTVNLLEACVAADVRKIVVASSAMALHGGVDPDDLPVDEHAPLAPVTARGAGLASIEPWLHAWQVRHDLDWSVLALATAYGPRQDPDSQHGEVAALAEAMLTGHDAHVAGDGTQTRDFVYVDDVVHAFALAAERGAARRYVIGTGRRTSVSQLFTALAAATRFEHDPVHTSAGRDLVAHAAVDAGLAARELGWKPWTTLEDGLATTLEWWAERIG